MKLLGNILWLLLCGFWLALGWAMLAALFAITVVGIPFALQCAKLASFSLWPFGRRALPDPAASRLGIIGTVLWIIPGLFMAASYVLSGLMLCLTVVGIPFGAQAFKLAELALSPFGKKIVEAR